MATSRQKYTTPRAKEAVITLASRRYSPSQILDYLERLAGEGPDSDPTIPFVPSDEIPQLRTIQRIVKDEARVDVSGTWSLLTADAAEAALVFPALAEMLRYTLGGVPTVTVAEGRMMARILTCRPELSGGAHRLARAYLKCQATGTPTTVLDAALAFAPWESHAARNLYLDWYRKLPDDDAHKEQYMVVSLNFARLWVPEEPGGEEIECTVSGEGAGPWDGLELQKGRDHDE